MIERRKFVRIPESSSISYRIMPKIKTGDYLTKDIGQGGLRFFIHEFIPKKSFLKIRLTIKNISFSFEALVRIVWIIEETRSERYEIGVEFVNISNEAKKHLVDYIKDALDFK
jgi:c-di-GMP-binding flagellar brake protein YcgR